MNKTTKQPKAPTRTKHARQATQASHAKPTRRTKQQERLHPPTSRVVTLRFGDWAISARQLSPGAIERAWRFPAINRDAIAEHYLPLVHAIAIRMAAKIPPSAAVDASDLFAAGWEGLSQCVERFDLGRGLKFETFATPRINGAMIDAIRQMDHVPRLSRQREKAGLEKVRIVVGLSVVGGRRMRDYEHGADSARGQSLESQFPDERCDREFQRVDDRHSMGEVLRGCNRSERILLLMYYWQDCTMKQIGVALGLSESRVSQMHSGLIARFRRGELGKKWIEEITVGA